MVSRVTCLLLLALLAAQHVGGHVQRWGADLIVVVTWFQKDIAWLADHFPLNHTRFVLYSKGNQSCATHVPATVAPYVAFCVQSHNAAGREAHTIAHFAYHHSHQPPRVTFFVHDDSTAHVRNLAAHHLRNMSQFLENVEAGPMELPGNCLCDVKRERNWNSTSYAYYNFQAWMADALLGIDVVQKQWKTVIWPGNAFFALPASGMAKRPRVVYRVLLELLNGTVAPRDGKRFTEQGAKLAWNSEGNPKNSHTSLGLAHAMERSWFMVFDTAYKP